MTSLTVSRSRTAFSDDKAIHWQSKRIGVLYHDEQPGEEFWDTLNDLRENILQYEGQFVSLDLAYPPTETFSEMLYAALKNAPSLQFSLPIILQHNPRVASPFLNHAILWQRLCDLIIVEDEPTRETVLVLENIDQASPAVQHEIARLIRFHTVHSIHRTFIFTLDYHSINQVIPELHEILEIPSPPRRGLG